MKNHIILATSLFLMASAVQAQNSIIAQTSVQKITHLNMNMNDIIADNPDCGLTAQSCLYCHWMDFDQDGDFDLLVTDEQQSGMVRIFKNEDGRIVYKTKLQVNALDIPELSLIKGLKCPV